MVLVEAESDVQLGYPDQLLFEMTDGVGDYSEIEEMKDFPMFGDKANLTPVTHRRSPGQRIENLLTFSDMAELTYEGNYVPTHTVQAAVEAAQKTKRNFRYVINDQETGAALKTWTFSAWIMSFMTDSPMEGPRKFSLSLKPSGALVAS
jgi:hypothetical protein